MNIKRNGILLITLIFLSVSFVSCKKINIKDASFGRKSGDGTTAKKAIVIVPAKMEQKSAVQTVTVNKNEKWFYARLLGGKTYSFSTTGSGDPSLYVYKESQINKYGDLSGDPLAQDLDGAGDGRNCSLTYRASGTGGYYVKIILYAGSRWRGNLKYKMQ